ncbi:hypothetical protein [Microbacterium nymphoidis]|jgi:hypothetical protein|uniref:hypothetical protein n=1 Tax=Microbacterium nymphoidis TaxID=2898586 RepID=UPI001E3F823E|nr:hypothetical protein [Microbacterium nymphoidis]MCD2498706.1 hypothetical protein [Microbacterium nymphoidis]
MRRSARIATALVLIGAASAALVACMPGAGTDHASHSAASSRDEVVAEIQRALVDSGEFDEVTVSRGDLTVGWDLDVAVSTEESLTGEQLDLMLRTTGERISETDIASVTFLHTPPGTVLGDNIHVAARSVDLVDKLARNGAALVMWRDEVVNYANARGSEG